MCTAAHREALTRDLSSPASSAPTFTPAPSQCQASEADCEGVAAEGEVAEGRPAMALAKDATVVNGKAIDQR